MKIFLRDQYDKALDKIKANIDVLKPYLENIQKASTSFLLKLVIVAVIVFSVIWLGKFTWKNFTNQDMFQVSPSTFSFETPDWATDEFINEIHNIRGLKKKYNIFEKDLTKKIVAVYENNPLISKVHYVEHSNLSENPKP